MRTDVNGVHFNPVNLSGEQFYQYSQDPDGFTQPEPEHETRLNGFDPSNEIPIRDDLPPLPEIVRGGELFKRHPQQRPIIIDGIARVGEIVNVIASPKAGKSWFVLMLAISVAVGLAWFGFVVRKCRVLIIDNELHPETLAFRFQKVAFGMGLKPEDVDVDFMSLRGRLMDITQYRRIIEQIGETYDLIIIDAKYRTLLSGTSENANSDETRFYNILDQYAELTQAAIVLVHHSTKGDQSGKSVTDVGAGGGAQSRAADTHLVIRPHEEDGYFVLEDAVRSFPKFNPKTIEFDWPVWREAAEVEPVLKQYATPGEAKKSAEDQKLITTTQKLFEEHGELTVSKVRKFTGWGDGEAKRVLGMMVSDGLSSIDREEPHFNGSTFDVYIMTQKSVEADLESEF